MYDGYYEDGPLREYVTCVDCGEQFETRTFTLGGPRVCAVCSPFPRTKPHCLRCQRPKEHVSGEPLCAECEKAVAEHSEQVYQSARRKVKLAV